MASSKPPLLFAAVIALLFIVATALIDAHPQLAPDDYADADDPHQPVLGGSHRSLLQAPKIDCGSACEARCGRNWKNKMCNKMCNICCGKCSCVPSGTGQDTRNQCPCYANMVNSKNGKPKCP